MDTATADFFSWLAQHQPLLYGGLLFLAFCHRQLSVWVGQRNRPLPLEPWYRLWTLMGRISGAAWLDSPASVKTILGPMPQSKPAPSLAPVSKASTSAVPELLPEGHRSGNTLKQFTGPRPRIDPKNPSLVILIGFLFAFARGCGASFYAKKQIVAGEFQEPSADRQKAETDELVKADWFLCNRWSDRAARGAQAVLNFRLEVARATTGASEGQSKAETWADKVLRVMTAHCELAKETSLLMKGLPMDPPVAPTPSPPVPSAPAPPTLPAAPPSVPVSPAPSPPQPVPSPPAVVAPAPPTPPIMPPPVVL